MKQKVLIIQNKQLGDIILSTVIADNVKRISPQSEVHFFCYTSGEVLVRNHPHIDKVISIKEHELKKIACLLQTVRQIRKEKYHLIFDPYNRLQSHLMCLFSGATKTVSLNNGGKGFFYTDTIPPATECRLAKSVALEDKLQLLEKVFPKAAPFSEQYRIYLNDAQIENGLQLLSQLQIDPNQDKILMIGIQGSGTWKSYPAKYMPQLIDALREKYNAKILFNYAPHQQSVANEIFQNLKNQNGVFPQLIGNNLEDMLCVLKHCAAVVACEGGLIHMAKGLEVPNLNIYSPFISRESWGTLEYLPQNSSVHLKDYMPELFAGKEKPEIEANSLYYYDFMKPEMILPQIKSFLDIYL